MDNTDGAASRPGAASAARLPGHTHHLQPLSAATATRAVAASSSLGRTGPRRGSYQASKTELLRRFQRVSGQVAGISRMVEEERYCPEVLVQIRSATAALDQIGYILLREHLAHCVAEGVRAGEGDAYLDEVMELVRGYSRR